MKHLARLLIVSAVVGLLLATVHPALANHLWYITGVSCDSNTHTVTVFGYVAGVTGVAPNDYTTLDTRFFVNGIQLYVTGDNIPIYNNRTVSFSHTDAANFVSGAQIMVLNRATSTQASTTCVAGGSGGGGGSGAPAVTFFDPHDPRLNGWPGDRIVVYCNANRTPPNIDIWVVDNSGVGHPLATLSFAELLAVPTSTFVRNLGVNGVLYAGLDANGNGYAALQGGPYGGTAKGDWLKTFVCKK